MKLNLERKRMKYTKIKRNKTTVELMVVCSRMVGKKNNRKKPHFEY